MTTSDKLSAKFQMLRKLLVNFKLQTFSLDITTCDKLASSQFGLKHTASLAKTKANMMFDIQYINEQVFAPMSKEIFTTGFT
jgi:hypothetical protein